MKIEGRVTDFTDGSALAFANVYVSDQKGNPVGNQGTQSTLSGYYSLPNFPNGKFLTVSYLGYDSITFSSPDLQLNSNFSLKPNITKLKEIIVKPTKKTNNFLFLLLGLGIIGSLAYFKFKK